MEKDLFSAGKSLRILSLLLGIAGSASTAEAGQMMGAQLESLQRTGYGLYVVRMKPASHPGSISAFFLYHSDRLWPKSWAEIDIEFTPGYRTSGDRARRFVLEGDGSSCYDPSGRYDSSFFNQNCSIRSSENGDIDISRYRNEDGASVNRSLSFNTYGNTPLVLNQSATSKPAIVQEPGDRQIFYNPPASVDPYADFYNYYVWYTPTGVYWSGAESESDSPFPRAEDSPDNQVLPDPVLAKVWNTGPGVAERFAVPRDVNFRSTAQRDALAYASDQFTPLDRASGQVLDGGRQLSMMINIWDGSQTVPSLSPQPWGGYQPPSKAARAVYQKIAFFPLKGLKSEAAQKRYPGPKDYDYDRSMHYSDFTSREGRFILNGQKASFDQLWMASDGAFAPLGILSGYSVFCYPSAPVRGGAGPGPNLDERGLYLQLRHEGDYAIPAVGQQENQNNNVTNCSWSDTRGY